MLLGEPPPSQGDLHFKIFDIPVRVHPFFWIVALILGIPAAESEDGGLKLLIWVVALFVSILIHELGHAVAALAHGWKPWVTLYGMGGLASYRPTYHTTRSSVVISFAGPLAGFLFLAMVLALMLAAGREIALVSGLPFIIFDYNPIAEVDWLIYYLIQINLFWGLVNLLPVYPLDGGQISREIFLRANPHDGVRQSLLLSIFTGAGIAVCALMVFERMFMALLFGYLAFSSYTVLQQMSGRGG
ncbi:MAG: site-2 protease family protein, partial [Pirellulales bacterium]